MEWQSSKGGKIRLMEGDITRIEVDAIVNAANSSLAGGGGVDGAIHRAGGPDIMRELDTIRAQIRYCPTGQAVATGAGRLPAKWVFHAVGPVYRDGKHGEPDLLASCYRHCLSMAEERAAATVSFPAISTGVYGYPLRDAAVIAVHETKRHLNNADSKIQIVTFVLFGKTAFDAYERILNLE